MKLFTLFLTNALTKKNEAKINVFLTTPLKNAFKKKSPFNFRNLFSTLLFIAAKNEIIIFKLLVSHSILCC